MVSNDVLRRNARAQLGNDIFGKRWLMMMAICLVGGALIGAVGGFGVGFLVTGSIYYGLARVSVNCARGKAWTFEQIFDGFKEDYGKTLLVGLLQSLFTVLWSLLLIVPGIVKSYSYAMASYIQQDEPQLSATECIEKSRRMMDGYKWQLFCLDWSFFGWYLLGALCFGIGTIFVDPYRQTAYANFYLALKAEKQAQGE